MLGPTGRRRINGAGLKINEGQGTPWASRSILSIQAENLQDIPQRTRDAFLPANFSFIFCCGLQTHCNLGSPLFHWVRRGGSGDVLQSLETSSLAD